MAENFQNLNITISGLEDTGQQIKIKDQNNRTYSFFKNKKGGGETVVFKDFQNFKMGDAVEVSFKEVPYKDNLIRSVLAFRPATGQPHAETVFKKGRNKNSPGREYWERRKAGRQHIIALQVAFKAAVELQSADMQSGNKLDKEKLFRQTLEFYDWITEQVQDTSKKVSDFFPAEDNFEQPF